MALYRIGDPRIVDGDVLFAIAFDVILALALIRAVGAVPRDNPIGRNHDILRNHVLSYFIRR